MAAWIKMPLGTEVGLGPSDFVLDRDIASPLTKKGTGPPILGHVCCGQMAAWIKMPLGMEIGLRPNDFVLVGDPPPLPQKAGAPKFSAHVYCGQAAR